MSNTAAYVFNRRSEAPLENKSSGVFSYKCNCRKYSMANTSHILIQAEQLSFWKWTEKAKSSVQSECTVILRVNFTQQFLWWQQQVLVQYESRRSLYQDGLVLLGKGNFLIWNTLMEHDRQTPGTPFFVASPLQGLSKEINVFMELLNE